jgi:2-iminobutanoate/2-iminopropanoate deaminase
MTESGDRRLAASWHAGGLLHGEHVRSSDDWSNTKEIVNMTDCHQSGTGLRGPANRDARRHAARNAALAVIALLAATALGVAQSPSPAGVKTLSPAGAIKPTGTWDVAARAGDFVFIAGMRGIDPRTDTLVPGDEARIRQAFLNMKLIAESEGATLRDCVRIVVYVTDMFRFRPIANKVQEELWGKGPYPPRTIVEVHRLNQDDILEVEGTFYAPVRKAN